MLNTLHLQTFLAVVEAGNYSAAAERLHMSQPAVSQHIRALEDQLDHVRLFRRVGQQMLMTHAGEDLVESAREMLALSARAEEQDKVTALESGADDYVTKPFSARELLARIKAVMRRRAPQLADDVVEIAGLRIDPAAHQVSAGDKPIDLWTTELRLLHFFMTHPGRVFSRARLLDEVWGEHVFVEERTVDVHIRRLRQALTPTGHDKLIETVRGTGYRFKPDLQTANIAA